jgi:Fungal Zn(2)-Cys(6) binuclear cluster domain
MASSTESEIHTSPESRPITKTRPIKKLRVPKACYPCYRRKVKCDRNSPCSLCVKRGYAHLCTFTHPPTTTKTRISPPSTAHQDTWNSHNDIKNHCCEGNTTNATRTTTSGNPVVTESGNILVDTQEWQHIQDKLAALSQSMHTLRSQLETSVSPKELSPKTPPDNTLSPIFHRTDEEKAEGVRTRNALGGSPVHCGSDSVMAFLLEKPNQRSVFREDSVLSQLVLDNQSATYPFLDLWSSHITSYSNESVCTALPDDSICRRYD